MLCGGVFKNLNNLFNPTKKEGKGMKKSLIIMLMVSLILFPTLVLGQGLTDKEVVIGLTTPLSGPAAMWGVTGLGAKAWADYINDQGGIHGRKIKVILKDDGYNPARAMANLQEMKGQVFAVTALLGTAVVSACRDFFPENKIPQILPYGNTRMFADYPKDKLRYIFVAYPDYEDEASFFTNYALKSLASKKLTLFYQNDDYGKMAIEGVKKALGENPGKAELVSPVPYEVTERALGTHALKLKESNADTVLLNTTMSHAALILKEMAKVGYRPKVIASFPMGDPIMYKIAGEVWEGVYVASPANSGVPGADREADKIAEILKKYDSNIAGKEYLGVFGAVSMMYVVEGLKKAGRNPTTDKMIEGLEKIKNWKPEGLGAPATFDRSRHSGVNGVRMMQARKGVHVPITDFVIFKPRF